jgi:hypothetical protein
VAGIVHLLEVKKEQIRVRGHRKNILMPSIAARIDNGSDLDLSARLQGLDQECGMGERFSPAERDPATRFLEEGAVFEHFRQEALDGIRLAQELSGVSRTGGIAFAALGASDRIWKWVAFADELMGACPAAGPAVEATI